MGGRGLNGGVQGAAPREALFQQQSKAMRAEGDWQEEGGTKARRRAGPGIPQRATRSSGLRRSPVLRGLEDHQGPAQRLGNVFGRRDLAARETHGQGRGGAQAQGGLQAALENERRMTERKATVRMGEWVAAHTRATT